MTTYKTSELEGALLDAAVALAERRGLSFDIRDGFCIVDGAQYCPSTDWSVGGPIIQREDIDVIRAWSYVSSEKFAAFIKGSPTESDDPEGEGPTRLIAAMRAYVASKLGETVELP